MKKQIKNLKTENIRKRAGITFLTMLALSITIAPPAFAVPANPLPVEFTQPDGSVLSIIIKGDERGREAFTLDGHLLAFDSEGFLTYARVGENGLPQPSSFKANNITLRKPAEKYFTKALDKTAVQSALERKRSDVAVSRALGDAPKYIYSGTPFPAIGEPRALVILIEYPDQKFSMDNPEEFFREQLNGENFNLYGAKGSARDYFISNSNGLFRPVFDVLGPVVMKNDMEFYGGNDSRGDDLHPDEMLIEACDEISKTHDLSIYDHDGDGYVDNVFMIYAGYGENDSYIKNTVWPHSAELETDFNRVSPDYNGIKINRYGCTCELKKAQNRPDGIGTFVHEFSHVLGLPDLYNTFFSMDYTPRYWSILDAGSYNNSGVTPCNYSAHERYALNWVVPKRFEAQGDYMLGELSLSNDVYIIPTKNQDEFYLLENRQKHGYDEFLPHHGLLAWHIDFDQDKWDKNIVNNIRSYQHVLLVRADNTVSNSSTSGDPFPGTQNVTTFDFNSIPSLSSWDGENLNIGLYDIREENETIYFRIEGDFSTVNQINSEIISVYFANGEIRSNSSTPIDVYNLHGQRVGKTSLSTPYHPETTGIYICNNNKIMVR